MIKSIITIWMFLSAVGVSSGQATGNKANISIAAVEPGNPLFIQYDYGTCYVNHERQITVEAAQPDSFLVTMKKNMPVAYRLYQYRPGKKTYKVHDSVTIKEPFNFKFPKMGNRDYCTVTKYYVPETSFTISRASFTRFMNDFIYRAGNSKLELTGTGIAGIYCYIQLKQNGLVQEYSFDGWCFFEKEIQQQK